MARFEVFKLTFELDLWSFNWPSKITVKARLNPIERNRKLRLGLRLEKAIIVNCFI